MKLSRTLSITVAVIIGLFVLLGIFAGFITDLWWFNNLGFGSVFWTHYETQYLLWLVGFAVTTLVLNLNLSISLRSQANFTLDPRIESLLQVFGKFIRIAIYVGAVVVGFFMAGILSNNWMEWLAFLKQESFGLTDPVFGTDISFFVFTLPLLKVIRTWLLGIVILSLIGTFLVYMIRQGISFAFGRVAISDKARKHMAILIAAVFLLVAWGFYLDRYDLVYSTLSASFFGAGYSDLTAKLPGLWVMVVASLLMGVIIVRKLFAGSVKTLVKPFIAYIVVAILATGAIPGLVQKFIVVPNEQSKELPYIENNIRYTRQAYDLNRIEERSIDPKLNLSYQDLTSDSATVRNIMLWDYRPLASTLDQLQVIRLYYDFPDVDIDRYRLPDGSYRQVMLSARELDQNKLTPNARTWVNQYLVYTHGYGLGMSPVNVVTEEGLPEFFVKDIPPVSTVGLDVKRPEVYFGEKTDNHVIVKAGIEEFDYPVGDQNKMTTYQEDAGVEIGSLLRRLVFAMRFKDLNILISGYISSESRLLYHRTIQDRVRLLAPFLHFDDDPFLVVADGRLYWIYDAYTTTNAYPYSKPIDGINYIRNSVKITIDAYNGEVSFYKFNEKDDPLIRVYERIFPNLFRRLDEMPAALREHIRYPQDLFDIQANVYETYHMTEPQVFYNKEDLWNIANEKLQESVVKMESYYAIMRLPGEPHDEFIQMVPYTPNKRDNMIAWLCARSDGANYGKMLVYKFPKQELTYGPMQISARIDQDPYISQQLTLWNQQGSSVTRGNLLVIPIKEELLYVQPVYLQATSGKLPELKRVIVSYGNRIAMESTLDIALLRVFRDEPVAEQQPGKVGEPKHEQPAASSAQIARSALDRYNRAIRLLKEGDWAGYGKEIDQLKRDLERMIESTK